MLTVIAFVVALSLLIVVHEFGHYWVARRCGVRVLRFSLGFGKPLWSRTAGSDRTEWTLAAIPLGGYVKMLDEREGEVPAHELHRAFNRKPVWQRFAIVLAGPAANFAAAIVIYWVLLMYGIPGIVPTLGEPPAASAAARAGFSAGEIVRDVEGTPVHTWQDFRWIMLQRALDGGAVTIRTQSSRDASVARELHFDGLSAREIEGDVLGALGFARQRVVLPPVIGGLTRDGAAARAGLKEGDRILSINGEQPDSWDVVVQRVRAAAGQPLQLRVGRGGGELPQLTVTPDLVEENGLRFGRIGASPHMDGEMMKSVTAVVSHGPVEGFYRALEKTRETAVFSLRMLAKMVTGEVSLKNLSGPITIADYAGQSAQNGWMSYLLFLALVSISLGVLNLLPIPLLDGGHLMYYSVEFVTGKPVPDKVMEVGQQVGMMLLFTLMAFALYNDINRLIGS